ncbi:hypothetical protein KQI89_14705 [Clostridium sp. MSJ-4]|uniref:Reverse transcriptase domain-containing protein n=1 Tax=Clostridium simiarum TaxID=2841506 RepID=A0ABS6F3E5_9CLOT|nr:reverse transcriptase domain-containing protein [Clostridium simiarum]MBU5592999.1 hypothetical protein [Clostridium simiarum]
MGWNGLERNKLDFILTDLLPVELSELFSFKEFYDFLNQKENQKILTKIVEETKKNKAVNNKKIFEGGWDTQPLKYSILKGSNSLRRMSIVQPLSAVNLYIFIETYQKDVLSYFEKEHCFSLRYHKKSSDLYYKGKSDRAVNYFHHQAKRAGKLGIQQMGTFFKTVPFESINSFTGSLKWRMSNFHYSYYAKIDYKSCFDSIYTHAFKWIIERNVIDSKKADHSSLFITIDRILQNINGKSSNGLIVGPEFSRMIAEILLQHIDKKVKLSLAKENIIQNRDFAAYRYVDDIFIFGKSQDIVDKIIDTFACVGQEYLLQLNELKIFKGETPCLPKEWLAKTRNVSDVLNNWFYSKQEYIKQSDDEKHVVKKDFVFIDRIKDDITVVIKTHESDKRTIVSYLLSTIFNNVSRKKEGCTLFGSSGHGRPLMLLDMAFFIYAFCPSYEQTRKLISIIVYINNELNFKKDAVAKKKLKNLINRYSFVFTNGNVFDLIDWFAFLFEYGITLDIKIEEVIIQKACQLNDPIVWANLLLYSKYNDTFFNEMKTKIEITIQSELEKITDKSKMLNKEFWFVLIFHNCPYISPPVIAKIDSIIQGIKPAITSVKPSDRAINLVYSFLQKKEVDGTKPGNSFFNWSGEKGMGDKITYRTYQRTIFKKYNKKNGFYTSLD